MCNACQISHVPVRPYHTQISQPRFQHHLCRGRGPQLNPDPLQTDQACDQTTVYWTLESTCAYMQAATSSKLFSRVRSSIAKGIYTSWFLGFACSPPSLHHHHFLTCSFLPFQSSFLFSVYSGSNTLLSFLVPLPSNIQLPFGHRTLIILNYTCPSN